MKIVLFGPAKRTGVLRDEMVVDISLAYAKYIHERDGQANSLALAQALVPAELGRFIEGGRRVLEKAEKALDHLFGGVHDQLGPDGQPLIHPASEVRLHAPRPFGARVACAGGNFADHAAAMAQRSALRGEVGDSLGDSKDNLSQAHDKIRAAGIWGFWKVHRESVPPGGEVIYSARARRLDYEGELALAIGKQGKDISAADAGDHIWGVTLLGDWSIRLASEGGPLRFATQQNFDTSCSIGPCISVGEVDPFDSEVETLCNAERRTHFNTNDIGFSFPQYMAPLSQDSTFIPACLHRPRPPQTFHRRRHRRKPAMHPAAAVARLVATVVPNGRSLATTTGTGLGSAPWAFRIGGDWSTTPAFDNHYHVTP